MGKNKTASSVEKSNFQLFKEKFREKSVNEKLKSDINESEKKKKKKNFWSKWLTSVRGSWSCGEARPRQVTSQVEATKSLEVIVDLFETPIDPEKKISKILPEPTNAGLNAAFPENCGSLSCRDELFPNKRPGWSDDFYKVKSVEKDRAKINQEPLSTHSKCLAKNPNQFNEKEPPQKIESLLTSALFIHKDIDRMVESAVFMEPNLPRDYTDSKLSHEISQKSLSINNVRVSYKGKGKDQVIKTFKTTSEPTWEERKKLIHRQRLKENINYVVKQFVFLEAEDVIDFSRLENNSSTVKKMSPFEQSSSSNSRDLSREVSPEILVNIKPFKEYVSENVMKGQRSKESPKTVQKQNGTLKSRPVEASENLNTEKVAEKRTCPVLKSTVTFLKKKNSANEKENSFGVNEIHRIRFRFRESVLTATPIKNEMNAAWDRGFAEVGSDNLRSETPSFSFWNVYETYSTCKNMLQVEVELENTSFQFTQKKSQDRMQANLEAEEDIVRNSRSLDEVLDTLEDGDHDIIFQKNMSQFKKKISVMPRLDFRKSMFNTNKRGLTKTEDKIWHNLVRVENPLKAEKAVAKVANFPLGNSREKKIEICRSEPFDLQMELSRKSERIMENVYFLFCETTAVSQILATRIEAKTFSLNETLREVRDLQENNFFIYIKVENPMNFDESPWNVELLNKSTTTFKKSRLVNGKENRCAFPKILSSTPNGLMKANRTASDSIQLFHEADERLPEFIESFHNYQEQLSTIKFEEILSSNSMKFSNEMKADEEGINEEKETEVNLMGKFTEFGESTSRKVALILNDTSYEYTVRIYEKFDSLSLWPKSQSEPDIFKNSFNEKRHQSEFIATIPNRETLRSGSQGAACANPLSKNYSDSYFDKSKKCLKNDEEDVAISYRCFSKSQMAHLYTGNEKAEKEEGKGTLPISGKKVIEEEMKKTVSASMKEEMSCREKPDCEKSLAIPESLAFKKEGEADRRNVFLLKKNGANLKKEVMTAINLIKDLNQGKGETKERGKQISLVILLSRN